MAEQQSEVLKKWSRKRRIAFKLLLILFGLFVGLLIAEIALRIAGYSYPVFYTTDIDRGYALLPRAEGWYRRENKVYVRINSEGLRDREHSKIKPPRTVRIAVIGDSYAEALQVPQERAFWSVLEKRLQSCEAFHDRQVEVINFGVSGYGTAQELITLRRRVWDYAPDIVLLAVTTNNDITDNSRALKRTDEIPYFIHREGQLSLDDSFQQTSAFRLRNSTLNQLGRWIREHLRVIQAIHEGHGAIKAALAARRARATTDNAQPTPPQNTALQAKEAIGGAATSDELGIDNMIYREPADAVWKDAWQVTEELMLLMRDEVQQHGAKFFVVTLSNGGQVLPTRAGREDFARRVGATDLFYPDLRIKALGEREGFPVWNLAPSLQAYAEQHGVFLHGFGRDIGNGHWNEAGHQVAGELIAQKLCEANSN